MKNKTWMIVAVLFAAVMVLALVLYPKLSEQYVENAEKEEITLPKDNGTDAGINPDAVKRTDDFTVFDMDGNTVSLSDFFGKPIVVNFFATWCGPCCSELPAFDNAYKQYGENVAFLMVNLTDGGRETKERVKDFVESNGYSFPVYLDIKGYASEAYSIYSIPETLFIRADGSLQDTMLGAMSERALMSRIEKLLGESK